MTIVGLQSKALNVNSKNESDSYKSRDLWGKKRRNPGGPSGDEIADICHSCAASNPVNRTCSLFSWKIMKPDRHFLLQSYIGSNLSNYVFKYDQNNLLFTTKL